MRTAAISCVIAATLSASPLLAQAPSLALELNAVEEQGDGCRVTFVATNGLAAELSALVVEAVIFTPDGLVDRLALLDFQSLPQARPRVRQFDLPDLACDRIGQVLINAVGICNGQGLAQEVCSQALSVTSRIQTITITG